MFEVTTFVTECFFWKKHTGQCFRVRYAYASFHKTYYNWSQNKNL